LRYGVLADVHGNMYALEAALRELEHWSVDAHLVAGDLVGYGPHPNECVRTVAMLASFCVAGNHDLIALGRLSEERCIPLARESLAWTRAQLTDDATAFLASLPLRAEAPGGVVLAHGSLDDPQEYTRLPSQALAQLDQLQSDRPNSRFLVIGHTHRAWVFSRAGGSLSTKSSVSIDSGDAVLINPGAVGQSRELRVRARCCVLDLDALTATFIAVPYDYAACRRALRRAGLSPRSCHLLPSPWRAAGRFPRALRRRMPAPRRARDRSS
jgi:diadenosine tetraphosphatase ApaH/serine/threonine PP2A family protein phosphatase